MEDFNALRLSAVRDRVMSFVHEVAERAALTVEVCFDTDRMGGPTIQLAISTRTVELPVGATMGESLRALQDQAAMLLQDVSDFASGLGDADPADLQTGIHAVESGTAILYASTCQAEAEEFLDDLPRRVPAKLVFIPVPLEEIPHRLQLMLASRAIVPECRMRKSPQTRNV